MNMRYYKKMSLESQINYVMQHGVNTGVVLYRKGSDVLLYVLADFYVEVSVERYEDAIVGLKAFNSMRKLEPYLEHIDIKEVYGILS